MKKIGYIQIEKQFPCTGTNMMDASYEERRKILEEILNRRIEVTPKLFSKKHKPDDGFMSLCFEEGWLKNPVAKEEMEKYALGKGWKVEYLEEDNRDYKTNGNSGGNGFNGSSKK
jgi:hypothetical protein